MVQSYIGAVLRSFSMPAKGGLNKDATMARWSYMDPLRILEIIGQIQKV
jgi:hypothetical protein